MPAKRTNGSRANGNENFAAALGEVSDRLTRLIQDEIELAKTEMAQKASSLARGAAAVAAGAVFGVFAVIFFLLTLAWVLDGIFVSGAGDIWLGFLIVLVILLGLTAGAFLFALKKLKVGAPTPKMAISEGRKIRETVTSFGGPAANGAGGGDAGAGAAAGTEAFRAAIPAEAVSTVHAGASPFVTPVPAAATAPTGSTPAAAAAPYPLPAAAVPVPSAPAEPVPVAEAPTVAHQDAPAPTMAHEAAPAPTDSPTLLADEPSDGHDAH